MAIYGLKRIQDLREDLSLHDHGLDPSPPSPSTNLAKDPSLLGINMTTVRVEFEIPKITWSGRSSVE